jgi:3-oxoadipate enol-lactonase
MSQPSSHGARLWFTTSDGCDIAYTLRTRPAPGADRVVLIHSLALDASVWDGVTARLAGHSDVLTYDCRGHGRSGRPRTSFTTELFAGDLAELLDHVGWPAATVAGCSMGGNIAQAFAGRHPSRVTALALIDTTAWYGEDARQRWQERADAARSRGLGSLVEFQVTRWLGDRFRAAHPGVVRALTSVFLANDLGCYAASCAMLGDADSRHDLPSFRMPVAVIVGEEDYATPVSSARQLHEALEGSTLTVLPNARHLTPVECPDQIASLLLALGSRPAAARQPSV